ncbi:TonB-dependent receptor plug domain-containing protein [Aurantiacibacter poecillastricola]|uniref:TonB-dependent receptor plug domain-containing protein n=1 Tax=Aurantiacibacter poecillastricola TaxID=3064385 RepID=UPI00273D9523|nr:TonB-dependent receptor [Aurantiacibacter sp. 219JJ12-13]MDP5262779.1 TonB-dependent receptor plug domain-containing protein [Aurantiacibacter sp. 219JJ12-13]
MPLRCPQAARGALVAACLFHVLYPAGPAAAQDLDPSDAGPPDAVELPPEGTPASDAAAREVYLPVDFERFAPRNAADLIEEIPGFEIDDSGGGSRGLGQAQGNLLINGDRLSSKSTSTAEALARIPVENVIRIEVVDGATLDIPGLSGRVANIIVEQGGLSGQFEWRPQAAAGPSDISLLEGEVSISGSTGWADYTIAFENSTFYTGSDGSAIFVDALGTVDERFNVAVGNTDRPTLNGQFRFDFAPGVVANLNLAGGLEFFRFRENEKRIPGNPLPLLAENFRTTNDEWFYEVGGDIEFPLGPGRLKLIALESFEDSDFTSRSLLETTGFPASGTQFLRDRQEGERIGRGEYSWGMFGADWQVAGEAAFNRLDQLGLLFAYDPGAGEYREIAFPAGVGGVREDRYEGSLSTGFPLAANLSVQLVAGAEYSQISQTGANALSRTFERPKGALSLAWAPAEGLDINLELARRVGQLDFGDFLASVNLSDDQQNAGNNDLRPQQNWDVNLEIAKNFGVWGSATLTLFDERIEDLVLIVPVRGGGEARGNIADARRYGASLTGRLELEPLGWRGAQLDVQLDIEDSELIDPVTSVDRRFDGNNPFQLELDLRHDVPRTDFAWGLEFRDTERAARFRVREQYFEYGPSTMGAVFAEHKDVLGATVRLRVSNLFRSNSTLLRTVYDGPRDSSAVLFTEERRREIGQVFNLSVAGSF